MSSTIVRKASIIGKKPSIIEKPKSKELKKRQSLINLNNKISKKMEKVKRNIVPDPGDEKPITKCQNCLNLGRNYLQLTCQHSLCGVCISRILLKKDFKMLIPQNKITIKCPLCKNGTIDTTIEKIKQLVEEGKNLRGKIEKSPCTVHKKTGDGYCLECKKWICSECKILFHNDYFKDHHIVEKEPNPKVFCKNHNENECDMYCSDCKELVCHICTLKGEYHENHRVITIDDFKRESLSQKTSFINKNYDDFLKNFDNIENFFKNCSKNCYNEKKSIMNELIDLVNKMKESIEKMNQYNIFMDNYFNIIKNCYFNFYYDLKDKEPTLKTLNFINSITKEIGQIEFKSEFQEELESIKKEIELIDKTKFFYHETKFIQHPLHLEKIFSVHETQIYAIQQLSDGRLATGGSDNKVNIWNLETLRVEKELNEHTKPIFCIIQLENNHIVTGSGDKTIKIWDLNYEPSKYAHLINNESNKDLLSKSFNQNNIENSEISNQNNENEREKSKKININNIEDEIPENIEEDKPDEENNDTRLKENKTNEELSQSMPNPNIQKNKLKEIVKNLNDNSFHSIITLEGHTGEIYSIIDIGNNGICSCSQDNTIKIWSLEKYNCIQTLTGHTNSVGSIIQISSQFILSGSSDFKLRLWDLNQENPEGIVLSGHTNGIFCLLLLKNGNVASGSCDKTIRIWDLNEKKCNVVLKGHNGYVWALVQMKEDHKIASGSSDGTIKIWDLNYNQCFVTFKAHRGDVACMHVLSDKKIATGGIDKVIKIWEE